MAFGVPGASTSGNIEGHTPIFGEFDFQFDEPVQNDDLQANEAAATSSVIPESPGAIEINLLNLQVQPSHNLVHYSVFNFEGGILNAPPLPPAVKEQILFATASYKDAFGRIHIHKNFEFSRLTPFEVATLYRVINSYHKFWEKATYPGHAIYHKHLDLIEEYLVSLAWEDPAKANLVIEQLCLFDDGNLKGLIEKLICENSKLGGHTRIEHANMLIQHAVLCFNYNQEDNQPKLLSEAVKKQIQHASCCYTNEAGELVIHKDFKFDHLSAQDVVMLFRVLDSYYRKWDFPQNGENAVFNRHLAQIEAYLEDLCWSNIQKARNVKAALEQAPIRTLKSLTTKLGEQLIKLNGYTLVPHAILVEQHARIHFNYTNDNLCYPLLPEPVKTQVRLSTKCYKNAEGAILVHKDFRFDHLTPAEFALLYRVLNSYFQLYDTIKHRENAVYHKHLSMMEEYLEGLCWTDQARMQQITDVLLSYKDPYLHGIIQKQISYLLNLLPYSLIDHANKWFNFDESNPFYSTVYEPLSDQVKEQIRFAVLTDRHVNRTKEIHKNFRLDHLSSQEVAQLYVVIYSYYDAYDHPTDKEVYKGHVALLQKHIEDIAWRDPARGIEVFDALSKFNSSGIMTGFIEKIHGIIQFTRKSALVPHADMLITYAEHTFNGNNSLSQAVKNNLSLAAVCYETENGLVIHDHFPSDDLSPEDLAMVFRIITAYSNDERYRLGQADIFQRHLAVLEEYLEKLCWKDLRKADRFRIALESFQDPRLQQMVIKLSYYIANLTGFNLTNHADFWFPALSNDVNEQLRYAALYHLQIQGSIPTFHPKFRFDHLSTTDLVTLYRIIKTYVDLRIEQDTSDYRFHVAAIDHYISQELPAHNQEKAREVREVMLTMATPEGSVNPILQKLNSHPDLHYDRSLFRYLDDSNKYKTAKGGGAYVYLYHSDIIFKKLVPSNQGVAVKEYFHIKRNAEKYKKLFEAEISYLKAMQGFAGVPRLLDYDENSRTLMMSALKDINGLDIIKQNPLRLEEVCVKHLRSMVGLHAYSNGAFGIQRVNECPEEATLVSILEDPEIDCMSHFRRVLQRNTDLDFQQKAQVSLEAFITRQALGRYRLAKCLNDSCIESYFPESGIFIDFNAASTSPIERDIAAAIINLLLNLKYNIGVIPTKEEMKAVLLAMINGYREEYEAIDENFTFNSDFLRFFFAQQLTVFSNALNYQKLPDRAKNLQLVVLTLLDTNQEVGIDAIVDMIIEAY